MWFKCLAYILFYPISLNIRKLNFHTYILRFTHDMMFEVKVSYFDTAVSTKQYWLKISWKV